MPKYLAAEVSGNRIDITLGRNLKGMLPLAADDVTEIEGLDDLVNDLNADCNTGYKSFDVAAIRRKGRRVQ